MGGQRHAPVRSLTPGKRAGLDWCGKFPPPPGFDPRTVQPVASRYTDWAIPAHSDESNGKIKANIYIPAAYTKNADNFPSN